MGNKKQITILQRSVGYYLPININGKQVQTVNPRTKSWPKFDPDPNNCTGKGHSICMREGEHSWFNHSQDTMSSFNNLPPEAYLQPALYESMGIS